MRWRYHAMYFQDDWRATPRLTINLGVRYEFNSVLADDKAALRADESDELETPEVVTGDFFYYRLRKPEYSPEDRKQITEAAHRILADGKDVFVFFKHEDTPEGALYAEEILAGVTS